MCWGAETKVWSGVDLSVSGAGITRVAYLDDSQRMPALDLCRGGPRDTVASHLSKKCYGATYRSLRFRVVEGGTTSEGAVASGYVLRSSDCVGHLRRMPTHADISSQVVSRDIPADLPSEEDCDGATHRWRVSEARIH